MGKKQARLFKRDLSSREGKRAALVAEGKCQIGDGGRQDVLLTDLDAFGCSVRGSVVGVTKGCGLQLWLGEVGPIAGRLRWARHGSIGIDFDGPLDEESLGRVCVIDPGPTVVPLRRRSAD